METLRGIWIAKHVILIAAILAINFTKVAGLLILPSGSEQGRILTEGVISEDETVRVDPLNNLKKYRGGYDIRNKHYWSSTAFTGIYGYAIAVLWLLFGFGFGLFLLITTRCCKRSRKLRKRSFFHNHCYLQPLLLAIFFTLLAVTACGLVFGGNSKFHSRAKTVIDVIIDAADEASSTIYNITGAMKNMSNSLREVEGNSQATDFLNSTSQSLDNQATNIERTASNNRDLIYKDMNIAYVITTVAIALTLLIAVSQLALGVLKFRRSLQVVVAFCWIFIIFCWLFFGIYFFLQNFAGDTCRALEGFQQDPYNNSLSSILPCEELLSLKPTLIEVSAGIYNLVNKVNGIISTSYGNIAQICNPFSSPPIYAYEPWNCPENSIRIGDIPKVLRMLACPDSIRYCNGGIMVPASYYNIVEAYCTSIQALLDAYPGIESLVECQTVKNAFSIILHKHCKPLKRYIRMIWTSLVCLSVVLVALVFVWTFGDHHERSHQSSGGSVNSRYDGTGTIECGATTQTIDHSEHNPEVTGQWAAVGSCEYTARNLNLHPRFSSSYKKNYSCKFHS
ncbi:hypothetical protein ACS0TY_026403 [Phlomoides rotata]